MVFRYSIERFHPPFDIYRCEICHFEKQYPVPQNPDDYYDEAYYTGSADFSYQDERSKIDFHRYVWNARIKRIASHLPPPGDFLDVGCAFGGLVEEASKFGYRAQGLDVSEFSIAEGKSRGLTIHRGTLESHPFAENSFDVITLIEVIEHLSDPQRVVHEISRLLRPGGVLVCQTADFDGRQAIDAGKEYHYYLPGHLSYFTAANLTSLLRNHGFDKIEVYRPVDFGLLPKLYKSRGDFRTPLDYLKWFRIAFYHWKGKLSRGGRPLTSSMVIYARLVTTAGY